MTVDELEHIEPDETPEANALHHQVKQLQCGRRSVRWELDEGRASGA